MEIICVNIFRFFVNFVSTCARYVHGESLCTGYVLLFPMRTWFVYWCCLVWIHFLVSSSIVIFLFLSTAAGFGSSRESSAPRLLFSPAQSARPIPFSAVISSFCLGQECCSRELVSQFGEDSRWWKPVLFLSLRFQGSCFLCSCSASTVYSLAHTSGVR
jgi:hypothetical protein